MKRIIDQLRDRFGGTWTYKHDRYPQWSCGTFGVVLESCIVNADLDQFCTRARRTDTNEEVYIEGVSGRTYFA